MFRVRSFLNVQIRSVTAIPKSLYNDIAALAAGVVVLLDIDDLCVRRCSKGATVRLRLVFASKYEIPAIRPRTNMAVVRGHGVGLDNLPRFASRKWQIDDQIS